MAGTDKIKTLYSTWYNRNHITDSAARDHFRDFRRRLEAAGAAFANVLPEPAHQPRGAAPNYSSDEDDWSGSSDDDYPEADGGLEGWALVTRLGLRLRSDEVQTQAHVARQLGQLSGPERARLRDWLEARAAELGANPYLATKSRGLRLQFAALGLEWFGTLLETPTLADYLEGEAQGVDLDALLA